MTEILSVEDLERKIEEFTLVPSDGGKFELSANGKLLYSKLQTGRHVEEGELKAIVAKHLNIVPLV
jgi:selenoprotein W-related protein